ncbi:MULTISPECIES: hypothetical protein [Listeria]|uniref:hypothetical protein n=1 Tax=Listeria TaxID=1637 RepID=UPI000B58C8A2|nr:MULTISPECIES: hypothetical protein [Listeria]
MRNLDKTYTVKLRVKFLKQKFKYFECDVDAQNYRSAFVKAEKKARKLGAVRTMRIEANLKGYFFEPDGTVRNR